METSRGKRGTWSKTSTRLWGLRRRRRGGGQVGGGGRKSGGGWGGGGGGGRRGGGGWRSGGVGERGSGGGRGGAPSMVRKRQPSLVAMRQFSGVISTTSRAGLARSMEMERGWRGSPVQPMRVKTSWRGRSPKRACAWMMRTA